MGKRRLAPMRLSRLGWAVWSMPLTIPIPALAGAAPKSWPMPGIDVTRGVLAEEARRTNLGHFLRVTSGRPMVTLKLALTADLYAAGPAEDPRLMVTGRPANGLVHVMRAMQRRGGWWASAPFWLTIPC